MPKSRASGLLEADHATDRLRELIVDGHLAPGERLVERSLADRLGLSRVPVREALQTLVSEGFATVRPTGGVAVRRHRRTEVAELLEISHALDAVAARRMLQDGTALTPLHEVLQDGERALAEGRSDDATALNARFHEVLLEIAPSPMVRETTRPLRRLLRWLLRQHPDAGTIHREHVELVDALAARDADRLEQVLLAHARTSRHALEETR